MSEKKPDDMEAFSDKIKTYIFDYDKKEHLRIFFDHKLKSYVFEYEGAAYRVMYQIDDDHVFIRVNLENNELENKLNKELKKMTREQQFLFQMRTTYHNKGNEYFKRYLFNELSDLFDFVNYNPDEIQDWDYVFDETESSLTLRMPLKKLKEDHWKNVKKVLDKFFFIHIMVGKLGEKEFEKLRKKNLPPLEESIEEEELYSKAQYLVDKINNYEYQHEGKTYKFTAEAKYYPKTIYDGNEIRPEKIKFFTGWQLNYINLMNNYTVDEIEEELMELSRKGTANVFRMSEHLFPDNIFYPDNQRSTFIGVGNTSYGERNIFGTLTGKIENFDIEWNDFKKVVDKWHFILFTLFELALKQREKIGYPEIPFRPEEIEE